MTKGFETLAKNDEIEKNLSLNEDTELAKVNKNTLSQLVIGRRIAGLKTITCNISIVTFNSFPHKIKFRNKAKAITIQWIESYPKTLRRVARTEATIPGGAPRPRPT